MYIFGKPEPPCVGYTPPNGRVLYVFAHAFERFSNFKLQNYDLDGRFPGSDPTQEFPPFHLDTEIIIWLLFELR